MTSLNVRASTPNLASTVVTTALVLIVLTFPDALNAQPTPGADSHPVNEWIQQSPRPDRPAPNFPYEGSGSYDPVSRRWIHHAGHDGIPQSFHTFTFDLDTGVWEQKFPPTSPPGVCCVDGSNAFDISQGRFVRFPGGSLGHGYQWSRGVKLKESPVWLYDPAENVWTNMRPPPYAEAEKKSRRTVGGLCSGATYDLNHEVTLSFGGSGSAGAKNALFAYDAYANAFYYLDPQNPPDPRDGMGLCYDTQRDKLVMFGSQYIVDERTWLFDLRINRWLSLQLDPHPPAQKVTKDYTTIPRLAYDSNNDVIICLAWMGEKGHETWVLDLAKMSWSRLHPAAEPAGSKSRSRNLVFDPHHNLFILETSSSQTNKPEIWTYRYRAVDPSTPARLAPPRNLQVVTGSDRTAQLSWQTGPGGAGKEFHVYRGTGPEPWSVDLMNFASVTTTRFSDQNLVSGGEYHYAVKAIGADGRESPLSFRARTQPRVVLKPVVSVLAADRVSITWKRHPAEDIAGHNLYRGLVKVRTVKKGTPAAWRDNDPEYTLPQMVQVLDIVRIERLNDRLLAETSFVDKVDLATPGPESDDYKFAVYAYIVRAVNKLGTESGPSPYALTIPSEPLNVLCREQGDEAELKWDASLEEGITGYHVYKLQGTWDIVRVTEQPLRETSLRHRAGKGLTRYWVVAVDALGQEGQPSTPAWFNRVHRGFFTGDWHQ